jgi:hypothetical protein
LAYFFASLAHEGVAPVGVSWAGQTESPLWFDTAREFTERWHHQQQIREAVGVESIAEPQFLSPVISTLIRATPYWYRTVSPPEGTNVSIQIQGDSGGEWVLTYSETKWCLKVGSAPSPDVAVRMPEDTAWRFLTRTISSTQAESKMSFFGDEEIARCFLNVVAIMMPKELR